MAIFREVFTDYFGNEKDNGTSTASQREYFEKYQDTITVAQPFKKTSNDKILLRQTLDIYTYVLLIWEVRIEVVSIGNFC